MKRHALITIFLLLIIVGRAAGQCTVEAGADIAICEDGTTPPLNGTIGGTATGATWSSSDGGAFTPSATTLDATWTPPAGFTGVATLTLTASGGTCTTESDTKSVTVHASPTADAGLDLTICQGGTTVGLGGIAGGSATGGTWSTPDGGTFTPDATTLDATWTPPAAFSGTATLTLTTINPGECTSGSDTRDVVVHATPTADAGLDLSICQGGTTPGLGGIVGGSATGGTWSTPEGGTFTPDATTLDATWTPPAAFSGTATLTLTTINPGECTSGSDTRDVVVHATPTADAGLDLSICQGGTTPGLGGIVGGSATGGTWSTPAGGTFTPNATTLNATWAPPAAFSGTAVLTLTTINPGECTSGSDTRDIVVHATPTANAGLDLSICQGGTTPGLGGIVGGSATGGTWSTPAGGTFTPNATALNATWTPPAAFSGTAVLTLTTINPGECTSGSDTRNVVVYATPTANAGSDLSICQGGTTAGLSGSVGGSATGGTWSTPTGGTFTPGATTLNATWTPPAGFSGTAVLTLTTTNPAECASGSDTRNVVVNATPTANAGSDLSICQGGTTAGLGGIVGGSATGGTWSTPTGGTFTPNATTLNATWTPPAGFSGTAVLTLTTINPAECVSGSDTRNVVVRATPTANAGSDLSICQGGTTAGLGGSVGGSATGGTWSTPAGGTFTPGATTLNATWTPPAGFSGTAVLTLTTTNPAECASGSDTKNVVVNPSPTLSGVSMTATCHGSNGAVTLTGLLTTSTFTVNYSFPDHTNQTATIQTVGTETQKSFNTAVTLNYADDNGHTLVINSITVTSSTPTCSANFGIGTAIAVNPLPAVDIVAVESVCEGETANVALDGSNFGTESAITYKVIGTSSSYSRTLPNVTAAGTTANFSTIDDLETQNDNQYFYILTIKNNNTGCEKTYPETSSGRRDKMGVNSIPVPTITGPLSVCMGGVGNYNTNISLPALFTWTVDGGSNSLTGGSTSTAQITWQEAGSVHVTVDKDGCIGSASLGPVSVNPVTAPTITGSVSICKNTSVTYTTATLMQSYQWEVIGGTPATGDGSSISVNWTGPTIPAPQIRLRYINGSGCLTNWRTLPVTIIDPPVPTILPGPDEPRVNSTGNIYLTQAGMTDYEWSISEGGTGIASADSYNVTWNSTGDHTVYVNYKQSGCKGVSPDDKLVHVKPLPSLTNVHINYNTDDDPKIGGVLEVHYDYHDGSSTGLINLPGFVYEWKRGAVTIGANLPTYTPTIDDKDQVLTCTVTPASTYGSPNNIGMPVTSTPTHPIEDLSLTEPIASEVCIDGIRTANATLTGKYKYTFSTNEGASGYKWIKIDTDATPVESVVGTSLTYILQPGDIGPNKEIVFEVTPRSANYHVRTGVAVRSNPLAKITGLNDQYGANEPAFTLAANVTGGFFSGPGVSGDQFSPELAYNATTTGPWVINHFRIYEYAASCSQKASQEVIINPSQAYFSPALNNRRLCSYDPTLTVTVENMQVGAIPPVDITCVDEDEVSDMVGIGYDGTRTITINPENLRAGRHVLTYIYTIVFPPLPPFMFPRIRPFKVQGTFIVERVRQDIKYLGLSDKYCADAINQNISVEGVNPLEGTDHWDWSGAGATGDLLDDERTASAVFIPGFCRIGDEYRIKYYYEGPLGCISNQLDEPVTVHDLPDADFNIAPYYNIDGDGDVLEPNNPGGVFSGEGMSGNSFIPSLTHEGTIDVTYTYTNSTTLCTNQKTLSTTVRKVKGNFNVRDTICYQNADINIGVENLPTLGTVIKNGFTNTRNTLSAAATSGATSALYSIPAAGEGNDTLKFSYTWDDVEFTIQKVINIDSLGSVVIYNLEPDQVICDDKEPFELTVSKTGGNFYGPVTGNIFDPSKATIRDTVTYIFKNPKSICRTKAIVFVNVYKAPVVDFIPYDVCINDAQDTLRFMNKTTSVDPVTSWKWEFDDEGTIATDTVQESGYLYLKGGYQKVALSAETNYGCFVRVEKTFNIGRRPEADFYWKKDCYHPGEALQLFDATTYTTQPKSWSWKSNGFEFSTSNNAVFPKADTGFIKLEYIVRTDYYQCHDTVKKNIYIRPTIQVKEDGYFQNFEAGKKGWIIGDTSSIWSFGQPSGSDIKSAASGNKAWYTANARDGSSSVESPCFDLSTMNRPIFKMRLRKDMDKDRDGAALQYKIGDESFWHPVGSIDDGGIEWYNSATISGKPGGDPLGWTTAGASDEGYKLAIHTLDELKGKKDVKFRIVYGSAGTYSDHDGIAFDDVFMGERDRHVLVEHFTSYNSSTGMAYKAVVDSIVERKQGDVINIQYHTNLDGVDSLYLRNPGEINARIMFYGLTRVPYTFVDGGNNSNFNMVYDYRSNRSLDSTDITMRTLVNSRFRLYIDPVISGRVLTVKGYIKALENVTSSNLTLFIAVTEKRNKGNFSGVPQSIDFLNVFRKFIPDASGILLKNTWATGDSIPISEKTWTIDKVLNSSDIEIIAFLQSAETKEVYQAFSIVKPEILVGIENPFGREAQFSIYPNPASDIITIGFAGPLKSEALIRIFNFRGEIIREYRASQGLTQFTVEDPGLKGGIYLVRVSYGSFDMGFRKLIVTED